MFETKDMEAPRRRSLSRRRSGGKRRSFGGESPVLSAEERARLSEMCAVSPRLSLSLSLALLGDESMIARDRSRARAALAGTAT